MSPDQVLSLLTLHANLQSTITRLLEENERLAQMVNEATRAPCPACAARDEAVAEAAAAGLDAQRNRNRDESNAI